jgi:tetratricopeptide (TPR) repeat protein/S1-C subfamily serine protease
MKKVLFATLLLTASSLPATITASVGNPSPTTPRLAQADLSDGILTPQQVRATAKNISVRITAENNGGSGVIIAKKASNYLILTNAHVVRRATKIEIIAPDGQKYTAKPINGGFNTKYDLALLEFTSKTKYTLADLSSIAGSPIEPSRTIYSAGFPFDSKDLRITKGQISQLSDIPFNDGTQIGYTIDKGEKGIRQGMSGGAIFDAQGKFLGINTISVAPILPNYTYNDGSKPLPKLNTLYARANWGIPVYNFLTNVKADILYGYDNLPKVEHQVPPTGYMAKLNIKARQMTVRIENSGGSGSGVIIAREGSSYYVLTAKHVLQDYETDRKFTNHQIITYDQDRQNVTGTVVAAGVDLAVVKFDSSNSYPLARLSGYTTKDDDLAFVGGFPGRDKINSPLWQWQLNPGFIFSQETGKLRTQDNLSFSNGYDLIYSSISYGGMSGGPVFDTNGNVIGIHGKTEGADLNSLGMSIQTFIGLVKAKQLQIAPNLGKLLAIEPNHPVALNRVDRDNVIATMENIPKPQPEDPGKRWLDYGTQLDRTRQYDKSIAAFDRAITKGEKLSGNYGKAVSLSKAKKLDLAAIAIGQAIASIPNTQRVSYYYIWSKQSSILEELSKYEEALKSIEVAISLKPDDLILRHQKATILLGQKNYAASIAIETDLIRIKPEWFFYSMRGLAKQRMGDYKGALKDTDLVIQLNPNNGLNYAFRSLCKLQLGDYKGALKDADRAIEINPENDLNYVAISSVKLFLQDYKGALKDANRAIEINPRNGDHYSNRGNIKAVTGDNKGAISDFSKAIQLNPKNSYYYSSRASIKYKLGEKVEAINDANKAIQIDPLNAGGYTIRGKVKAALGDRKGAIADLNKSISIDSKNPDAYLNRSIIKSGLGDKPGAIADMRTAAELFRQLGRMDLYQKGMSIVEELQKQ